MKIRILYLLIATASLFIFSCEDEQKQPFIPQTLVEEELFVSFTKDELLDFILETNIPLPTREVKYDVDIYKVTYKTSYLDQEVIASGFVALPKTSDKLAMLSFQHGTIASHADAPTAAASDEFIVKFYAAMAAPGFVGVVPDFIGFGSSKNIFHPYYVEKPTADAVIDNVKAARELALVNNLNLSNRLFLAGYSQGGYATMAAHKAIEEQNGKVEDLQLIASFPSSGGYDIKGMQEYFFGLETYDQPFYLAYVALAYKQTYNWDQDLSFFFKEPYVSKFPDLFDGSKSGSEINSELTKNIADYIQPDILANIDNNTDYKFVVDAFKENSLIDWTPTIPMYMFHGDADITVPYDNSVATYNTFIQNGASTSTVSFTTLPFATHSSGVTPYIIEFINKVLALK